MSGRRVLDLVKILRASRSVVSKNIAFQQQRLNAYTKTSILARKVRSEVKQLNLALRAALGLASRFRSDTSNHTNSRISEDRKQVRPTKPETEFAQSAPHTSQYEQSVELDHGYQRSTAQFLITESVNIDSSDVLQDKPNTMPSLYVTNHKKNKPFHDVNVNRNTKDKSSPGASIGMGTGDYDTFKALSEASNVGETANLSDLTERQAMEQVSHEEISAIFHSPKISRMLHKDAPKRSPWEDVNFIRPEKTAFWQSEVHSTMGNDRLESRDGNKSESIIIEDNTVGSTEKLRDESKIKTFGDTASVNSIQGQQKPPIQYQLHESRIPSSRIGRLWHYGGLATSMAFGAVGEGFRRATGSEVTGDSLMLSGRNVERLVSKLSRMRGAALKLGQMISFQDSKILPSSIQQALQRVQDSADYMPASQRNKVLVANLGADWRDLFASFEEVPMAAASIGQVHGAILKSTGMPVAVKVQYPGVSASIDSDLNNISILLTASRLLPKGLYLDKTIANARTELAWECDYIREASAARRFSRLLADERRIFTVPAIVDEASSKQVLTMERMSGVAVTKSSNLSQEQRDWIGTQILRLCLRELTEFRFMQSDPNWTNFLYNGSTNKLELLDFGASREYSSNFVKVYLGILKAASVDDRALVRDLSAELGYLTGQESKAMLDAHIASILTLAEPFTESAPSTYDFRDQTITDRVRSLIPIMIRERLAPPPEETYSLHRKLSGAFLLCARLGSRVRAKELFQKALEKAPLS